VLAALYVMHRILLNSSRYLCVLRIMPDRFMTPPHCFYLQKDCIKYVP